MYSSSTLLVGWTVVALACVRLFITVLTVSVCCFFYRLVTRSGRWRVAFTPAAFFVPYLCLRCAFAAAAIPHAAIFLRTRGILTPTAFTQVRHPATIILFLCLVLLPSVCVQTTSSPYGTRWCLVSLRACGCHCALEQRALVYAHPLYLPRDLPYLFHFSKLSFLPFTVVETGLGSAQHLLCRVWLATRGMPSLYPWLLFGPFCTHLSIAGDGGCCISFYLDGYLTSCPKPFYLLLLE